MPCDQTLLATVVDTIAPITSGWARNLSADTQLLIPASVAEQGFWCAWMARHAEQLAAMPWADDCAEELTQLAGNLAQQLTPPPTARPLPDYATVDEIADATGKTIAAVRKWCHRHRVTQYTMGGRVYYRTQELPPP
ncbi:MULTISPECIES: hypothetical protein [Corynebacterium]|uniref:hypothetical protein n=1 Tax=Corynebacterium TaxID=1716 RepID=UPI00124CCBB4|nr:MULTISPECIES: hypothetical protein [Corynebacterium]